MKKLIIYFSWSNNTKTLAEEIAKELNIDIVRLERKVPYSRDYNECAYVEAKEEVDRSIHPEIKELNVNFESYDKILLFFPIWWYTFPMPVASLIEKMKGYKGEVQVFANSYTNSEQYMINSMRDLKNLDESINFTRGLFNQSTKKHIEFIGGDK